MRLTPIALEDIDVVDSFEKLVDFRGSQVKVMHHDSPTSIVTTPCGLIHGVNLFGNAFESVLVKDQEGRWPMRPASSYCIRDAIFYPWLPLLLTKTGGYIAETAEYIPQWGNIHNLEHHFSQNSGNYYVSDESVCAALTGSMYDGLVIVFSSVARANYGHFFLDGLSTAYAQHLSIANLPHTILTSQLTPWQGEIIRLLGLDGITKEIIRPVHISRVIISSHTARHLQYPGRNARLVVDALRFRHATNCSAPRRVYIRREPGTKRDVLNREEVEAVLRDFNFHFFEPWKHSVKEQIQMLGRAEIVVGQNGAGMMNSFFAPSSAEILDIMPDKYPDYWLRANARQIGMRWNLLICQVLDKDVRREAKSSWPGASDFKYEIPLNELRNALTVLAQRSARG